MSGDFLPAKVRARFRLRCAFATFETAHRLRAEGASVYDSLHDDELEMPGQVCALNYLKECRAGAFMAHP
jgi:hypothetical protein